VRRELKGAAMFLFERASAAKGKNREPGLQENPVRDFTGRQPPPGVFLPVFLPKIANFVVANSVGYLRAIARVPPVYLPRLRLEIDYFILKNSRLGLMLFSLKKLVCRVWN